jgi:recombination protein RecA
MPRAAAPATPDDLMKLINTKWGAGTMKLASDEEFIVTRLPTGNLALDDMLNGGFARGRYIELFGGDNVGKTAVTLDFIATTQANGGVATYMDIEGTFDSDFAAEHGVDLGTLGMTRQADVDNGHRVVDVMEMMLRSRLYDVIVLDSIASLLPKPEMESSMEDPSMGTEQARLMSKALRKLTAANHKTVVVFINQTRQAINAAVFAKQSVTSGGRALPFYAGTRIELVRTENIKRNGKKVNVNTGEITKAEVVKGHRVLLKVEKDKTGSANRSDECTLVYDYELGGFDPIEDLLYLGRKYGLIKKSGSNWWLPDYPDDKKNGRPRFKRYLRADPVLAEELTEAIQQASAAARVQEVEIDDATADSLD